MRRVTLSKDDLLWEAGTWPGTSASSKAENWGSARAEASSAVQGKDIVPHIEALIEADRAKAPGR